MAIADTLFLVVVIIFSAVIHEVMHGVAADKLGDPTARYAGRLTLNPIPHLDMVGSILLPLVLAFTGSSFFFAWAKPVPRSEEHTSELQSQPNLVCRLLLEKKNQIPTHWKISKGYESCFQLFIDYNQH